MNMSRFERGENIVPQVAQDNCFDFLRFFFAFSLIIVHFCIATDTSPIWFVTGGMCVKAFFTIAGFLVSYSFLRGGGELRSYTKKRFARIVPAYIVCVMFCFLVGWGVSSLPSGAFLQSPQTWKYFCANVFMLNWLEPELPGAFQSNPLSVMNGSLWTMKQEVLFYALVPVVIGWMRKATVRKWLCGIILVACVASYHWVNVQTGSFMYFFSGLIIFMYFEWFCRWKKVLLLVSGILLIPVYVVNLPYLSSICHALMPVCFPALIIGFAYQMKPLNRFHKCDNITYGLYLYHFPVIQVLIHYGLPHKSWSLSLLLAFVITALLASLSWFFVEKPLMQKCRKTPNF